MGQKQQKNRQIGPSILKTWCFKDNYQESRKKTQRIGKNICKSYMIRGSYPDYRKNFHNSIIKTQINQLKDGQII